MIKNFTEVKPLKYWVQHILPLVYDDSLSYMELLGKVVNTLNEVVKNNNMLPDYIVELVKEYISSGEFEKVLADVLANYMLNVKFPPAGLKPATGDGSADDTEAIQGCIDYAYENGGMSVYFPSGSYLTQPLILRDKVTLFGQDRYTTRLVMKGGATTAMFTGDVDELTLTGLGFDGNMDIQVNNVNLFTISVNSAIITNCLLTDGYELLNITVNDDLQLNDVIFKHAVENALVLKGTGIVQGHNLIFKSVSALVGKNFVVMDVSKSILEQLKCYGASPNAVLINGSNNVVKMWNEQSLKAYTDNGVNNTVEVYTQSEQKKLTGFKTTDVSGDLTETVGGNKTETITGEKEVTANTSTENIANEKHVIVGTVTEDITSDKHVNASNSVETIQGDKTITAENISETAVNKTVHITNDSTEQTDGTRTLTVTGANNETTGAKTETINGNKIVNVTGDYTETYNGNHIKIVSGISTETYNKDRSVTENNVKEKAKNYEINTARLHVITTKPIAYNHNPSKYNNYFNFIPMSDFEGNDYKVLVANEKTNYISTGTFVNVKDFGAVGDALYFNKANNTYWKDPSFTITPTNDVTAFENAIQYAENNNIGTIFIPDGAYYLPNKSFTINTSKLRFVGENKTKLVSVGLTEGCFIALSSDVTLDMYSYARMPLENICISGSYFTDEEKGGVCGLSFGYGADKPSTIISPHIAIKNVTIQYFASGIELASAYKTIAVNLNIIACNFGIYIPNTLNAIIPYNIYGAHIECCNWGIYTLAGGYSELNIFGGAFEYNRGIYTGTSKTTFYGVRFESDLTASCTKELTPRNVLVVSGSQTPYVRFIGCNFLFLPNYVDNVSYWINNPYKLSSWGDTTVIAGSANPFTGAYDFNFESCEFATAQYTTTNVYFVSGNKIYANGCTLLGGLNKDIFFNTSQLVTSNNGIIG